VLAAPLRKTRRSNLLRRSTSLMSSSNDFGLF
jgi:hypothetical protein